MYFMILTETNISIYFKHWQTLLRPIEKCQRNVLCNVAMDVRAVEK